MLHASRACRPRSRSLRKAVEEAAARREQLHTAQCPLARARLMSDAVAYVLVGELPTVRNQDSTKRRIHRYDTGSGTPELQGGPIGMFSCGVAAAGRAEDVFSGGGSDGNVGVGRRMA